MNKKRALQVGKMQKGACQVVRGMYFRGVQREDCSLFLSLPQPLSIKNAQPSLESHRWGVVAVCPCHSSPSQQFKKKKNKRQQKKSNRKTGQLSVLKCRNTLRNKIRSYGTTERTIFFLLLSGFSKMTSSEEAATKTIWCVFRERQNVLSGCLLHKRRHGRSHGCSIPLTWAVCL